jgi:hypothetical protein
MHSASSSVLLGHYVSSNLIPARFLKGGVGCMTDIQAEEVSQTFLFSSAS